MNGKCNKKHEFNEFFLILILFFSLNLWGSRFFLTPKLFGIF